MSVISSHVNSYYYGSPGGAEIDLILEFSTRERWAIEIKRSSVPSLSKGFHIACEDVKPLRKYVVYGGFDTFSMGNDITAISLPGLMREVLKHKA